MTKIQKILNRMEASLNGSLDSLELDNKSDFIEKSGAIGIVNDLLRLVSEAMNEVSDIPLAIEPNSDIEYFYCVSSNALVHGNPCEKWCGDINCKSIKAHTPSLSARCPLVEIDADTLKTCIDMYKSGEKLTAIKWLIEEAKQDKYTFGIKWAREYFESIGLEAVNEKLNESR